MPLTWFILILIFGSIHLFVQILRFIPILIFGSIRLFVQTLRSTIGHILATRKGFVDEKNPSSDTSTPRTKKIATSGKCVDRKSKAAPGVVNRYIVSDDDQVSTPEPDDLDNIQKIFRLGLDGPYKRAVDHSKCSSTREPGSYDRHLDINLRPTKVAYCSNISAQLAEVAKRRYEEYKGKLGMPPECEETNSNHVRNLLEGKKVVGSEDAIIDDYAKTMGEAILPIVSALAFETPSWKPRYIEWKKDHKQDMAIPDASIRINLGILPPEDSSHDCPYTKITKKPSDRKRRQSALLDGLRCYICDNPFPEKLNDVAEYFADIVLYEFKSLASGTFQHLTALLEQTCHGDFCWKGCDERCSHARLNTPVTGRPTGFDAENPVIRLTASDWGKTDVGRSLGTSRPLVIHRKNHKESAKRMIQQIWSEMVKHDATFLVLNSGNFEIIVVRDRGNRTLYLSDLIVTADPGYFQIHVGLFIAAIQDAIDRATRLNASKVANDC
ncbi:hypothetical protein F5887DRAFT_1256924 [Amanita rubescens]|nr:hypothetical protein F5887DRAFT_1256924 [Amanita rubescens]